MPFYRRAREKLLHEEKLAAMGRLSSAIAHEIRNPVAMIASSIATAKRLSGAEREEMFATASEEAGRRPRYHPNTEVAPGLNVRQGELGARRKRDGALRLRGESPSQLRCGGILAH